MRRRARGADDKVRSPGQAAPGRARAALDLKIRLRRVKWFRWRRFPTRSKVKPIPAKFWTTPSLGLRAPIFPNGRYWHLCSLSNQSHKAAVMMGVVARSELLLPWATWRLDLAAGCAPQRGEAEALAGPEAGRGYPGPLPPALLWGSDGRVCGASAENAGSAGSAPPAVGKPSTPFSSLCLRVAMSGVAADRTPASPPPQKGRRRRHGANAHAAVCVRGPPDRKGQSEEHRQVEAAQPWRRRGSRRREVESWPSAVIRPSRWRESECHVERSVHGAVLRCEARFWRVLVQTPSSCAGRFSKVGVIRMADSA